VYLFIVSTRHYPNREEADTMRKQQGFTLAELLIALAILGVIATFTIPKILTSTGTAQFKAVAKETAGTLTTALQDYSVTNAVTTATQASTIMANVNFVTSNTSATTTDTGLNNDCSATHICLQLHNGAFLQYTAAGTFGAITTSNYIPFNLDPDGTKSGATNDIVTFRLYSNGKITVPGDTQPGGTPATVSGTQVGLETANPSWFAWAQ
jgi:prepilin-type N-terminal cleavage/methylation domain-containing protein